MKVTQLNKDRIIRIPIDLTLSCKTWKMTIKKEFNGKVRKDIIQTTREGGIKSCDLNNIFTISEYIAYHELEDRKMLDEELEAGIKDGFESVIKYIKIGNYPLDCTNRIGGGENFVSCEFFLS